MTENKATDLLPSRQDIYDRHDFVTISVHGQLIFEPMLDALTVLELLGELRRRGADVKVFKDVRNEGCFYYHVAGVIEE